MRAMNNQYIETMNNHRPSLTMWQYYWRAWTFPKEKRASRTEAAKVTWGMLLSSMILGFFIIVIIEIFGHGVGDTSSFGEVSPQFYSSRYSLAAYSSSCNFSLSPGFLFLSVVYTIPGKAHGYPLLGQCYFFLFICTLWKKKEIRAPTNSARHRLSENTAPVHPTDKPEPAALFLT